MRCVDGQAAINAIERGFAPGFLALALVATALHAAEPPVAGLGWLRDLAGHCWRGE